MDVCLVIKQRLEQLGFEQKDLAAAAEVTESYISQLLTRKKLPPAPDRTDIYEKMGKFLKLSSGRLAKLAELQRREELKEDSRTRRRLCFMRFESWYSRSAGPKNGKRYERFLRSRPLANSNASSHRSFWT